VAIEVLPGCVINFDRVFSHWNTGSTNMGEGE
jgi:hypothetical protein